MRDSLAFFLGYVLSLLITVGIYMYNVWDSLYPSLCDLQWFDLGLVAAMIAIPAMLLMILNMIIRDR